jgi:hypothetical protein
MDSTTETQTHREIVGNGMQTNEIKIPQMKILGKNVPPYMIEFSKSILRALCVSVMNC